MKRKIIIFILVLCSLFLLHYLIKYNINHPVGKLSLDEIDSIRLNNEIYDVTRNESLIREFLAAYNKAKINRNQELYTTPDFVAVINLKNRESIRILDGDGIYCHMEYKDKSFTAYSPDLVKFLEDMASDTAGSDR